MNWPQLMFAVVLILIGGVLIAYNAMIFWLTVIRHEQAPSVAPIFGGVVAALGVAALPLAGSVRWAWIALLIDWGGLWILPRYWISLHRSSRDRATK